MKEIFVKKHRTYAQSILAKSIQRVMAEALAHYADNVIDSQ